MPILAELKNSPHFDASEETVAQYILTNHSAAEAERSDSDRGHREFEVSYRIAR